MNRYMCTGRLTKDAEVKKILSGEKERDLAKFTVAVDRKMSKEKRETEGVVTADFIPCVAYDNNARFVEKYLKKGSAVIIEGRIQTGSYINKDGDKCYSWDVVIDSIEFGNNGKAETSEPQTTTQQIVPQQPVPMQAVPMPQQPVPMQTVPMQMTPQQPVQMMQMPMQAVPMQMAPQQAVPMQTGFFDASTGAVDFN